MMIKNAKPHCSLHIVAESMTIILLVLFIKSEVWNDIAYLFDTIILKRRCDVKVTIRIVILFRKNKNLAHLHHSICFQS